MSYTGHPDTKTTTRSLPFPPPTPADKALAFARPGPDDPMVVAAKTANAAAAAARTRPDPFARLSPNEQLHAKINGAVQRMERLWSTVAELASDFRAFVDDTVLRIEQLFGAVAQHDDELVALRERVTRLETDQDDHYRHDHGFRA